MPEFVGFGQSRLKDTSDGEHMPASEDGCAQTAVIIPTNNGAGTLERAVNSVLNQSFCLQVIIVDDGSDEETRQVISRCVSGDSKVSSVRLEQASGRPALPRNRGVESVVGARYLIFLDDDDEMLPGSIGELQSRMGSGAAAVVGDVIIDEERTRRLASDVYGWNVGDTAIFHHNLRPLNGACIDRRWFERIGGFDTTLPALEDWQLILRMIVNGGHVEYISTPVAVYYPRPLDKSYWRSPETQLLAPTSRVRIFEMLAQECPERCSEIEAWTHIARKDLGASRLQAIAKRCISKDKIAGNVLLGIRELGVDRRIISEMARAALGADRSSRLKRYAYACVHRA